MSNHVATIPYFPFINLPGEIREVIYKIIISGNPIVYDSCGHHFKHNVTGNRRLHVTPGSSPRGRHCANCQHENHNRMPCGKPEISPYSIAFTSKTINDEFLYYAYKSPITFILRNEKTSNFQQWDVSSSVLDRIEICRFQYDMEDILWPTGIQERELYVPDLRKALPQLKKMEAEIVITKELSNADEAPEERKDQASKEEKHDGTARARVIHPIDFDEMCQEGEVGSYVIS